MLLTILVVFKAKNNILQLLNIEIKINMTLEGKKFKVKIKMVLKQWQQLKKIKIQFYLVKTWNLVFSDLVEGDKNLVGESTNWGIFLGGREWMINFLASAGLFPVPCPIRENPPIMP